MGTRDYAVDVQLGIIYAIRGNKWERMPGRAELSAVKVDKSTPVVGPIDKNVKTPTSQEPVPIAESTRKEGPVYANEPMGKMEMDATPYPDSESMPRPEPAITPILPDPRKRLQFEEESDEEENGEQIRKEIKETKEAEEALIRGKTKN